MTRVTLGIIAISAIALIVFGALAMNALPALIIGVIVLGVISIALSWVGVNLFSRYTDAQHKTKSLLYNHIEKMAEKGYIPVSDKVKYVALPAPQQGEMDIPVSTSGETMSTVAQFQQDAYELLCLSKQVLGENQNQVAPYHKARKNEYFSDVAVWMRAVQFLLVHAIAEERYSGKKKLGTFLRSGTIGQALNRMRPPTGYLSAQ